MVRWARNHKGTYMGMDKSAKLNPCLLIRSKFPMWEDNKNKQTPKPGLLANVHEGSIFTGIKRLSWIVKPNHRFFYGFPYYQYTLSISILLFSPARKSLQNWDCFPVWDVAGTAAHLVALEVTLLHRHFEALHISTVTRIGALQQQVLGLHLSEQRPHVLRRDILSAQLILGSPHLTK